MLSDRVAFDIEQALMEADVHSSVLVLSDDSRLPRTLDSADWFYYWRRLFGMMKDNIAENGHMPHSWVIQYHRNTVRMWEAAAFDRKVPAEDR